MRVIPFFLCLISFSLCTYAKDEVNTSKEHNTKTRYEHLLKRIKVKINRIIRPGKTRSMVAVIGVRGNRYDPKTGLYWKTDLSENLKERIKEEKEIVEKIIVNFDPTKPQTVSSVEDYIKNNPNTYFLDELNDLIRSTTTSTSNLELDSN